MIRAFHKDATRDGKPLESIVELGPGAGALTDRLMENYGSDVLQCIEIDPRAVEILNERYPDLVVHHQDVLQVNYPEMADQEGRPLVVIGNLPYYITSQILFALADASHSGAVQSATVTMQWEVAQRMVAPTKCKASKSERKNNPSNHHLPHFLLLYPIAGLWNTIGRLPNLCRGQESFQNPTNCILSAAKG